MRAPTRIPMTTQRRRPKIEVRFESCVSMNAPSKIDIVEEREREREIGSELTKVLGNGSPEKILKGCTFLGNGSPVKY